MSFKNDRAVGTNVHARRLLDAGHVDRIRVDLRLLEARTGCADLVAWRVMNDLSVHDLRVFQMRGTGEVLLVRLQFKRSIAGDSR